MIRLLLLILLFTNNSQIALGQSPEDKRRIEEEKRADLLPSEAYQHKLQVADLSEENSDQNLYFKKLLSKEVAVLSDAYRTLVILLGVDDQFKNPDSQFNFLQEKGIVPKNIGTESSHDEPLRKGAAAYMFAKAMDVKGGITLRLLGVSQRYALKELVYQGVMIPGIVHDFVSGQELILTLTQAADYMAEK